MAAKEFLIGRIVEEANRRHVDLSDTERKMLYFSQYYDTLPDMKEVAHQFAAECQDHHKYETKIRKLSRQAFERDRRGAPEHVQLWKEAIRRLKSEDHYLVVMLDVPGFMTHREKVYVILLVVALLAAGFAVAEIRVLGWVDRNLHFPVYLPLLVVVLLLAFSYYIAFSKKGSKIGGWLALRVGRIVMKWF